MRKITADSVKANNHYFKSFGSAVMIVLIRCGDIRRLADRTILRNMDVQPILQI